MDHEWLWVLSVIPAAVLSSTVVAFDCIAHGRGSRACGRAALSIAAAVGTLGLLVAAGARGAFMPCIGLLYGPCLWAEGEPQCHLALVWWKRRQKSRGRTLSAAWEGVADDYPWRPARPSGAVELIASAPPAGRGTEMEAAS